MKKILSTIISIICVISPGILFTFYKEFPLFVWLGSGSIGALVLVISYSIQIKKLDWRILLVGLISIPLGMFCSVIVGSINLIFLCDQKTLEAYAIYQLKQEGIL